MSRARLAISIETWSRRSWGAASREVVPIITEQSRVYDFELADGLQIATGPHGLWTLTVIGRRVGLDDGLIAHCELEAEGGMTRRSDPLFYLLEDGWMPDIAAAIQPPLPQYLPDETVPDPVELARTAASTVQRIRQDHTDLPIGLDSVIRMWADKRNVPSADAG